MARSNVVKLKTVDLDKGYRFKEEDRDQDLEFVCNAISRSGMSVPEIEKALGQAHMPVSNTTIYNWLNGNTRKPQNFTMSRVAFAVGYERVWRKIS